MTEMMPILASSYSAIREDMAELRRGDQLMMVIAVPMAMLLPHASQAMANHSQTLSRLAERGGLSPCEALAILENRRWHPVPKAQANKLLGVKIFAWMATQS